MDSQFRVHCHLGDKKSEQREKPEELEPWRPPMVCRRQCFILLPIGQGTGLHRYACFSNSLTLGRQYVDYYHVFSLDGPAQADSRKDRGRGARRKEVTMFEIILFTSFWYAAFFYSLQR